LVLELVLTKAEIDEREGKDEKGERIKKEKDGAKRALYTRSSRRPDLGSR
jgi:hypothetical protein